ncbi:site-specific integrase [Algibacter sp. L3A6]|uniref:site-specific integrase n=1 Tax=Algibacter sp. L3A6 TaxID=2686366 RepID=UPI00131D1689|nr:site-specific integrase [Algibacter sp. L3A6]
MKLNILYLLYKSKTNSKGLCPIRCRITYSKKRKEFSTGQFVNPKNWNSKQQLVKPLEPEADHINSQLSLIKTKINKAFLLLQIKEENFTVNDVYSFYKGEKTSKPLSIPLLPNALEILEQYKEGGDYVFTRISNQRYNSYLKEIANIVGINKNLTTHIARKTFASTVLLYNDVPMEIVSELLGHSSMKITQDSYGKVVQKKVSLAMERLKGS